MSIVFKKGITVMGPHVEKGKWRKTKKTLSSMGQKEHKTILLGGSERDLKGTSKRL